MPFARQQCVVSGDHQGSCVQQCTSTTTTLRRSSKSHFVHADHSELGFVMSQTLASLGTRVLCTAKLADLGLGKSLGAHCLAWCRACDDAPPRPASHLCCPPDGSAGEQLGGTCSSPAWVIRECLTTVRTGFMRHSRAMLSCPTDRGPDRLASLGRASRVTLTGS